MEVVTFKVDGEWFTDYIRKFFYAEDFSFEECKHKLIDSLSLHSFTEEQKNKLAEDIIYGEKKLVGCNSFELVDDTEFDLYNYSRIPRPENFSENGGVIGILTTDGVFGECRYGGHSSMLDFINNKHGNCDGAIIFANTDIYDYAFIDDGYKPTRQQIKWFDKNKKYLSFNQKHYFELMLNK
ncbi:Uncharacterised protein [Clostridium baratii]|uniref:hypothetical protein n=1 Tax=Clostridium baratii TaxID=1561 RepID=UPI0006BB079C|nr:hypothetical protein [Clostridium baratii]CUO91144.1 Uncharacterised protein [Clostridium baratii]